MSRCPACFMVLLFLSLSLTLTLWLLQLQLIKETQSLDTQKVNACPIRFMNHYLLCVKDQACIRSSLGLGWVNMHMELFEERSPTLMHKGQDTFNLK